MIGFSGRSRNLGDYREARSWIAEVAPDSRETHAAIGEHLWHMTDGRWHDNCGFCLRRRRRGGDGLTLADRIWFEHRDPTLREGPGGDGDPPSRGVGTS